MRWFFALLLLTGIAFAQSQRPSPDGGEQRQTQPNPTQQSPAANQQNPIQPPLTINVLPTPKTDAERAEDARERKEKAGLDRRLVKFTADLAAYTARLYYATLAVAIATIFLVVATAGLAVFGFVQSRDTKTSIEIARKAYVAEHRTWLKVYPASVGSIAFIDGGIQVSITIVAENIGNRPAIDVDLSCEPFRGRGFVIGGKQIENFIEFERKARIAFPIKAGNTLMPGEKTSCTFTAPARTDPETEAKADEQIAGGVLAENLNVTLSAVYCAIYKSPSSEDLQHTGHVVWLTKLDRTKFDPLLGDVEAKNIKATVSPYCSIS
jgi:hypothetical protein